MKRLTPFWLLPLALPAMADITRLSEDADGMPGHYASWSSPGNAGHISADGRFAVFYSDAANLHSGDIDIMADVYLYDRATGTLELISRNHDGTKGNNHSTNPALSADGRYVAFQSEASNLHPDDTDTITDIYVYDRDTALLELISRHSDGIKSNGISDSPGMSADGRYVVFRSDATNLHADDTDSHADIYVYDRNTGIMELVSRNSDGIKGNFHSLFPALSADGRHVAFRSHATNLDAADTDTLADIYAYDRLTGSLNLVSRHGTTKGNAYSYGASISANGRYVAFYSYADNLDPVGLDNDKAPDIYVHDQELGTVTLASHNGISKSNSQSTEPSLSADGRHVAFSSNADNLLTGVSGWQVYLYDRELNVLTLLSHSADGTPGDNNSSLPSLSPNADLALFSSLAGNLDGAGNDQSQVFIRDTGVELDPSPAAAGAFVTGSGHIQVPAGSLPAHPGLSGTASFNLQAKYQKGKLRPQGHTEFQFQLGGLDFQASVYDWLELTGAQARYQGRGTINGSGEYGFMVSVTDGDLLSSGTDRFHIRIWRLDNGQVTVFNNDMTANNNGFSGSALSDGQIVISESNNKK